MGQQIPLFSAARANEGVDLLAALKRVVERNWFVLGEEVTSFEREFAAYVGAAECISVANGTDALEIALRALGIGPGKRVALAANAGFYGSTAVRLLGAEPVYTEIDDATLTMSAQGLQQALAAGVDAVIVTHLYGQLADIEQLCRLAQDARVPLIEDCAQSHGALRGGRMAGSFGDVACFSFYPTKNLGAIGDGGAIVTSNAELNALMRRLRQYGWSQKYHVSEAGGRNSRLDELQAAVLRAKLPLLNDENAKRRDIARQYNAAFAGLPLRLPASVGADYVAHLYVVRVAQRERFTAAMREAGVGTDIHYPVPDHLQQAHSVPQQAPLPLTEAACTQVVSLPCFPGLSPEEVQRVIAAVRSYFDTAA